MQIKGQTQNKENRLNSRMEFSISETKTNTPPVGTSAGIALNLHITFDSITMLHLVLDMWSRDEFPFAYSFLYLVYQ